MTNDPDVLSPVSISRNVPPPASGCGPAEGAAPPPNLDAPVRVDVAMPRILYDRLTDHDEAPRSRYDQATGIAEFVAEPGMSHEWRAWRLSALFTRIEQLLDGAGRSETFLVAGAARLLSDDGAFEPDTSLYIGREKWDAAMRIDGWLDPRKGHPAPDLVVEIDRSVKSSHKLAPYFRLGVREAWTWSRRDGVRLWTADAGAARGVRETDRSIVLPGLTRDDLDRLVTSRSSAEVSRESRRLARLAADAMLAGGGPAPASA